MGPSFTLARPLYNKVSYVRAAHTSLDVMDRYTLLHVGYHLTACGKWILASCVDERGEAHDLGVWLTQSPADHEGDAEMLSDEEYAVKRVWDFAMQFAKKTDVEWRVVFTRLGVMTESELNGMSGFYLRFFDFSLIPFLVSMDSAFLCTRCSFSRTTAVTSHSCLRYS